MGRNCMAQQNRKKKRRRWWWPHHGPRPGTVEEEASRALGSWEEEAAGRGEIWAWERCGSAHTAGALRSAPLEQQRRGRRGCSGGLFAMQGCGATPLASWGRRDKKQRSGRCSGGGGDPVRTEVRQGRERPPSARCKSRGTRRGGAEPWRTEASDAGRQEVRGRPGRSRSGRNRGG